MGEFVPHDLTSNTSHSPFVISASNANTGQDAFKAFDGNPGDYYFWQTLVIGAVPVWLKVDLGSGNSKILDEYRIKYTHVGVATEAPKDWTIEGSNDDTNWDVIDTVTNETTWTPGGYGTSETRVFNCDTQTTAYRYFKINITANNGSTLYNHINELYFFEAETLEPSNQNYFFSLAGQATIIDPANLNFSFSILGAIDILQILGNLDFAFSVAIAAQSMIVTGRPTYSFYISGVSTVLNPIYLSGNPTFRFSTNGTVTQNIVASLGSLAFTFSIQGQTQQEVGSNNYLRQFINDNPITPANGVYTAPSDPVGFDDELEYLKDFMGIG